MQDDEAILERARAEVRSPRAHFNHAGMSLTPQPVLARVQAHLELEADLGGYEAAASVADELAQVPLDLAQLLGARAEEIVPTESATRAWETVVWALAETFRYSARDRILVDRFTYATVYSTLRSLELARQIEITVVPSLDDGTLDPTALASLLDERTRLVVVTHMPTHLGTLTDVQEAGRLLAGTDIVFAVDISQTVGQLPIDVAAIGCDIAFAPGRKFLRAPRGTGVLYVRTALAEQLIPLALPFGAIDPLDLTRLTLPPAARRFDQFEFAVATRLGLGAAARYATAIGLERIARLVAARSRAVVDLLASFDEIELIGTPDDRGIISFIHRALDPATIQCRLSTAGVNTWVNPAGGAPLDAAVRPVLPSVRVSPHYLTTDGDLARLEQALQGLMTA